jgi:hypothetical protein
MTLYSNKASFLLLLFNGIRFEKTRWLFLVEVFLYCVHILNTRSTIGLQLFYNLLARQHVIEGC